MDIGIAGGDDAVRDDENENRSEGRGREVPLTDNIGDACVEAVKDAHFGDRELSRVGVGRFFRFVGKNTGRTFKVVGARWQCWKGESGRIASPLRTVGKSSDLSCQGEPTAAGVGL